MENRSQAALSDIERAAIQVLLARQLTAAVHEINQMGDYGFGNRPVSLRVHRNERLAMTEPLANPFETETPMSAIERLKTKAAAARNVAPDAIKKLEADLDRLLAEQAELETRRAAAIAPHQEAIAGVKTEIDGIKSAIDILSNGEPA